MVALILEMSKNAKLLPTMIRILHSIWEHHDAVYPHLHDLLIAPLPVGTSVASVVNILLSKALTTKEMCEIRYTYYTMLPVAHFRFESCNHGELMEASMPVCIVS